MKTIIHMPILSKATFLHLGIAFLFADSAIAEDIVGDTTVQGTLTVNGNLSASGWGLFQQGIDFGDNGEGSLTWWPGSSPAGTVTTDISWEDGTFMWRDAVTPTAASNKMGLDAANVLTLFRSNGTAGITASPETGKITLPAGNGSTTGSGIYFGNSTTATITASSTGTPIFSGNASFSGGIAINSSTPSTSSITGALTVAGGFGAATDSYINGVRIGRGPGNVSTNTVIGSSALFANTTGYGCSAFGRLALNSNTSGHNNSAIGHTALRYNTTGHSNSAAGSAALTMNTSGTLNTAAGTAALNANTTGSYNTAIGAYALVNNTGHSNVAIGQDTLGANTTGSSNVAIGRLAGYYHADGTTELTDPENSVFVGYNARGKDNADNNSIVIGANAVGLGANTSVIGNSATTRTHLHGQTTTASLEVTGSTSLQGQVIMAQPQGDISMGQYQ